MVKRMLLVLISLLLALSLSAITVKAVPSQQTVIFLCEKQEYAASEMFQMFALTKHAIGYAVKTEVRPDLFLDIQKLRKWLGDNDYAVAYAIGNLGFVETQAREDRTYPIEKIKWDAPLWWPKFSFKNRADIALPNYAPKILARIPVDSVKELEAWISVSDVVSEEIRGVFVATNILTSQSSRLFPHYQYKGKSTYDQMKKSALLMKNYDLLVEKRGDNPLSTNTKEKQLNRASFVEAMNKSNLAILSATADAVSELYYEKKDVLVPIAKLRKTLATSYLENNIVVEEDFWSSEDVIEKKNRIVLLQNFYNDTNDLQIMFKVSRCIVTMYPNTLFFHLAQNDKQALQLAILKKFLEEGNLLADAIVEGILESVAEDNNSKCDLVVWGDPLISASDLVTVKEVKVLDAGFAREIYFQDDTEDIEFLNLPAEVSLKKDGNKYIVTISIPVTAFIMGKPLIIESMLVFEFQNKDKKGWVFLKMRIFNWGGFIAPPFLICIKIYFLL